MLKMALLIVGPLWAVSLDLKDAYYHVPIHPRFQKYLALQWGRKLLVFQRLAFGFLAAPWVISRVICLLSYLGDFLLLSEDEPVLRCHLQVLIRLLSQLGLGPPDEPPKIRAHFSLEDYLPGSEL